jgi:hypothetical protein
MNEPSGDWAPAADALTPAKIMATGTLCHGDADMVSIIRSGPAGSRSCNHELSRLFQRAASATNLQQEISY